MIANLGSITSPLGVIRLNGDTRLIVSPWAAVGTDTFLIGTGVMTFAYAKPTILRIAGATGAAWGLVALFLEVSKLIAGSEAQVSADIRRE